VTCRPMPQGQQCYRFCPDDSRVAGDRVRGLVWIRVVDEITNLPPEAALTVSTRHQGLIPRVSTGGIVGVVGNPMRIFPQLGVQGVDIEFSIAAQRYITRRVVKRLDPIADFPGQFRLSPPTNEPEPLHRQAVSLRGRVVKVDGGKRVLLPDVTVSIAGVWSTFPGPEVDAQSEMEQPNLIYLTPGLYAERTKGASTLKRCEMVLSNGVEKTVVTPAPRGTRQIAVSDRVGLGVGDVLAVEPGHPELAEFIRISQINGSLSENLPATVTLAYPLANDHIEGTNAVRAELVDRGPENVLARDASPEDRVAFLNEMAELDSATKVELGGAGQLEYHSMQRYATKTNEDGYFRLPPISRVAQLRLHAELSNIPAASLDKLVVSLDYRYPENHFDIVFP
jgi:hypothetical protein